MAYSEIPFLLTPFALHPTVIKHNNITMPQQVITTLYCSMFVDFLVDGANRKRECHNPIWVNNTHYGTQFNAPLQSRYLLFLKAGLVTAIDGSRKINFLHISVVNDFRRTLSAFDLAVCNVEAAPHHPVHLL
jgi:hypothetical protein